MAEVDDLDARDVDAETVGALGYHLLVAEQDGYAEPVGCGDGCGAEHVVGVGFGKHHALGVGAGGVVDATCKLAVVAFESEEFFVISRPVFDGSACHSALHGSACYGGAYGCEQTGVEGGGDNVFTSKLEVGAAVGCVDYGGHGEFGYLGDGLDGVNLHGLVDLGGTAVERAAEYVGKAEHVVDLVGIVGASRGHDDVGACGCGCLVGNLGVGIGEGKHDGAWCHRLDHLGGHDILDREAEKYVGVFHGFGQCGDGARGGKEGFLGVEVGALVGDHSLAVTHDDVFFLDAEGYVELGA